MLVSHDNQHTFRYIQRLLTDIFSTLFFFFPLCFWSLAFLCFHMTTNILSGYIQRQVLATFGGQSCRIVIQNVVWQLFMYTGRHHTFAVTWLYFSCLFYQIECCLPLCTWNGHFGPSLMAQNISVSAASLVKVIVTTLV